MTRLALIVVLLPACTVSYPTTTNGRPDGGACMLPPPAAYANQPMSFAVAPDASTTIPDMLSAYSIISNGAGSYTLNWTNATDDATCFTGLVTGIDAFTMIAGVSGEETIANLSPTQIAFASAPGTSLDGVSFFEEVDPIIVDVSIGGMPTTNIYYTDGSDGVDGPTEVDPVAFHSP